MKTTLLTASLVIATMAANAETTQRLDSTATFTGAGKYFAHEIYSYDAAGHAIYYELSNLENGKWALSNTSSWSYDQAGNMLSDAQYSYNNGAKVGNMKQDWEYDENNCIIAFMFSFWNYSTKDWLPSSRFEYNVDDNGRRYGTAYYMWSAPNWIGVSSCDTVFDDNGRMSGVLFYSWNYANAEWYLSGKSDYTYDANGDMTVALKLVLSGGAWVNDSKGVSTYDAQHRVTCTTEYEWQSGQWKPTQRSSFTYSGNGVEALDEKCENNVWRNQHRSRREYDGFGNITLEEEYEYSGLMIGVSKRTYTFDTKNRLTGSCEYAWNSSTDKWYPSTQITQSYDDVRNMMSAIQQQWNGGVWQNISRNDSFYGVDESPLHTEYYEWKNNDWVKVQYMYYYYSTTSAISNLPSLDTHPRSRKTLRNGRLQIEVDGKMYQMDGSSYFLLPSSR